MSVYKDDLLPDALNITQFCLEENAKKFPNKVALVLTEEIGQEQNWTYQQIYDVVMSLAAGLQTLNFPSGSRLVIHSKKDINFILIFFAAMAASLVPIATLADLTKEEVMYIIHDCGALLYYENTSRKLHLTLPKTCQFLSQVQFEFLKEVNFEGFKFCTKPNDPAYIIYTSGSTSKPKGIIHGHRSVIGREPIRKYWLNLTSDDIVLVTGKLCWTYSMGVGFMDTWTRGATALVYIGEVSADVWFNLIEYYKVTLFAATPYYLIRMSVENFDSYDISSLRQVMSAGIALPYEIIEFWKKHFNVFIYEALGMTEMSTFISSGLAVPIKKGKVGKIQPGRKVAILSVEGKDTHPVEKNQMGLLAIHQSNLGFMLGYLHPEQYPTSFRDEWFMTGDLVSMDEDGYIHYYGRYDDVMIVQSGERVSPVEIETVLLNHEDILDAACALLEQEGLKILTAFIVLKNTEISTDLMTKQIIRFLQKHLAPYKIPESIVFVENIPRNVNGKIIRKKLHDI